MSEDPVKEKLKQGLLKKIKETYHIKKDYEEALSYVSYFISNLGSDDEILLYKKKIQKKLALKAESIKNGEKEAEPPFFEAAGIPDKDIKTKTETVTESPEGEHDGHLLESEFLVDSQEKSFEKSEEKEDRIGAEDLLLLESDQLIQDSDSPEFIEELPAFDTFDDMFELEKKDLKKDQEKTGSGDSKIEKPKEEGEIFDIDNHQFSEAEKGIELDLDFDSKDENNSLDHDQEIVDQPADKFEKKELSSEKDVPSEINEVETSTTVDQEDIFSLESPQISSINEEIVEIQTETSDQLEPDQELSLRYDDEISTSDEDKQIVRPSETPFTINRLLQIFSKKQVFIGAGILIVLIVLIIFLLANGNNNLPETTTTKGKTVRKEKSAIQKTVKPQKEKNPAQKSEPKDTEFEKYLSAAQEYYQNGNYENSQKNIQLAKKIKTSEKLIQLEKQVSQMISEKKIQKIMETPEPLKKVEPEISAEEKAYKRISSSDNISNLEKFLNKYPVGKYTVEVRKRINELKIKEREIIENQIRADVRLYKKVQLRSEFQYLSIQNIRKILNRAQKIKNRYEIKNMDGEKVIIDYVTGLMWHFWEEPMEFTKAKWWSGRRYAGYHDWRLPSADEVSSLLNITSRYLPSKIKLNQYELWSGDYNNTDSSSLWVFILSERNFRPVDLYQYKNVGSVRSLIK